MENNQTKITPNQQFTYQNWTGLVYIDLNPYNGDAGYIIGEGLNGGYTVEQWPDGWGHLWRTHLLPNLTANIITPTQGQPFYQGSKIPWFAHYESVVAGQLLYGWNEQKDIKTDPLPGGLVIGNNILRSGYGTNQTVEVVIKQKITVGTIHPDLDDVIIAKANKYGIPPGILKAIIHKETENNLFVSETSRYEPKRDFQDFSGYDAGLGYPTRNINTTAPFSYYRLSGINTRGQTIENGTRVDSLPRDYKTTLKNTRDGGWQLRTIILTDRNRDGILTVDEIYANDYAVDNGAHTQAWPVFGPQCEGYNYTGNFTPQFLLSSSYGLGHAMYLEATEALDPQGNFIMQDIYNTYSPHDIVDNVKLGIELAASILKGKFKVLEPDDDCAGWSEAVLGYNFDSQYQKDVCGLYTSKYK